MKTAIGRQQPGSGGQLTWLPSLKEIHVLCEVPGYFEESPKIPDEDIYNPPLSLGDIWPIFYLKGLHRVHLYDFDPDGFSQLFHHKMRSSEFEHECHIEHLHVATKSKSICRAEDVTALLTLPAALRSLSFSWDDDKAKSKEKINGKRRNVWQISNNEVWTAILKYSGTLEYLDVFHDFPLEPRKRRLTDYFGSLSGFVKLRYLSIQAEMIIGGYVQDSVAPNRLKETVPASLETLDFAAKDAGENIHDLPLQLEEVVSQIPHLTTLELTDTCAVSASSARGSTPAKYQPLKEACCRNGVRFSMEDPCRPTVPFQYCPFPSGMRCLSRWKETYNMRVDAGFQYDLMRERATRKAAGLRESPSPGPPEIRVWTIKTHVLPFQNHGGNPSFMVFESKEHVLLPPLFNFNIYFTHPEGPLAQTSDLEDDIRDLLAWIRTDGCDDDSYRLDVYFLPNASSEDCIAHYEAEKATREGSRGMCLEAEIRLDTGFPPPTPPRLPGMLETYDHSRLTGVLFVHPDRSWRNGAQGMRYIRYEADSELGQGFCEDWHDVIPDGDGGLGELISDLARDKWQDTLAIYQEATRKGWTTW